ncbi:predicted protein [Plenodomus lingam JN3]|uniref:Uncharacterized protein n=1 Tax=Leptosphaeria maculans (strain JN3 / isolate v23.1.3 / race Av1-4-5-6-7-8) TaxID=985895 RepID=E5A6V5_LEPMJ|nr:predicted protein [Plenodomus lingam JN3]CBX99350.1 predicted protein [Plenodomus lingam JN3]
MDITKFIVDFRESAFLLGDYSSYRAQLSRRLRIVRKKLGRATPKNAKFAAKDGVTAAEIGENVEYVHPMLARRPFFTAGSGGCATRVHSI